MTEPRAEPDDDDRPELDDDDETPAPRAWRRLAPAVDACRSEDDLEADDD